MAEEKKPFSVVTLDNIAGGSLPERFEKAWEEIIANVRDPNTNAESLRGMTIKIKIKPDADRRKFAVIAELTTKTAPLSAIPDTLYLGRDEKGAIRPFTFDTKQADLFPAERSADVLPITQVNGGK